MYNLFHQPSQKYLFTNSINSDAKHEFHLGTNYDAASEVIDTTSFLSEPLSLREWLFF